MKKNLIYSSLMICALAMASCGNQASKEEKDSIDSINDEQVVENNDADSDNTSVRMENELQDQTDGVDNYEQNAGESHAQGYHPPFEFTAEEVKTVFMVQDNTGKDMPSERTTIKCKLMPGGRISGTYKRVQISYPGKNYYDWTPDEYVASDRELSGKWSTSWRSMGDGRETCYGIDISFLKTTLYLPESGDYLYMSWIDCEDNNTYKSYKVLSIKQL